ncbi:Eburicol 14-alpha-demethylase [Anopheles sinensis]|uniref:Eburicol 14-alpha-demethylase n=1 Tax=Anopheles sinensis TaxID=74873 RepID=A0A084WFL6_ANOSI|nr:Eburicol 14-alpha-demethylase [Anopheles sinensis]
MAPVGPVAETVCSRNANRGKVGRSRASGRKLLPFEESKANIGRARKEPTTTRGGCEEPNGGEQHQLPPVQNRGPRAAPEPVKWSPSRRDDFHQAYQKAQIQQQQQQQWLRLVRRTALGGWLPPGSSVLGAITRSHEFIIDIASRRADSLTF